MVDIVVEDVGVPDVANGVSGGGEGMRSREDVCCVLGRG